MSARSSMKRQPRVDRRSRVETIPYIRALCRMIRAAGRRAADGDEPELRALVQLRDEVEAAIQAAAQGQANSGRSWSFIAEGLGTTRQGAHKRYGRTGGAR